MDSRDLASRMGSWYDSFDEKRMVATVEDEDGETTEIPCEYKVCDLCEGKGHHVNPSIDSEGISAYEFYEDPDFAEDYFRGAYDVPCHKCHGKRVVPWPINEDDLGTIEDMLYGRAAYARECEMERRFGA